MFLFLRLLGAINGAVTGGMVLLGMISVAEFFVADLVLGGLLLGAALIPRRAWAWRGLMIGNAYALGVFTVALAQQFGPQGVINPALMVAMAAAAVGLIGLLAVGSNPTGAR